MQHYSQKLFTVRDDVYDVAIIFVSSNRFKRSHERLPLTLDICMYKKKIHRMKKNICLEGIFIFVHNRRQL